MSRRLAALVLIALLPLAAGAAVSPDPKQAPAGAYQLETRHTQVVFAIRHFGITNYYGRFDKVSGSLQFNPTAPEKSSVSVTVDMSSADVMSSELVGELVGPHVFDSAKFPTATFVSGTVTRTGPATGKMTGDLTLHGVTKPVTFDVDFNGGTPSPMGGKAYNLGFHATTTIKRSDFGLTSMIWSRLVSDEVNLTIEAMFVQQRN